MKSNNSSIVCAVLATFASLIWMASCFVLLSGCEAPQASPPARPKSTVQGTLPISTPTATANPRRVEPKPETTPHARIVDLALQEGVILARLEVESDPTKRKQLETARTEIARQRQAIYPEKNKP